MQPTWKIPPSFLKNGKFLNLNKHQIKKKWNSMDRKSPQDLKNPKNLKFSKNGKSRERVIFLHHFPLVSLHDTRGALCNREKNPLFRGGLRGKGKRAGGIPVRGRKGGGDYSG